MPTAITVPAPVAVVTEQLIDADALSIDKMVVDGSGRDKTPWTASITACPYIKGDPSATPPTANQYSTESLQYQTDDLLAAATNMAMAGYPALAQALSLIMTDALPQWHLFCESRRPALDTATAATAAAQADADAKAAALVTATAARTAAFRAINQSDGATLIAYDDADQAFAAAGTANDAAKSALKAAQDRQAVAQAAVADPANPPLEATA